MESDLFVYYIILASIAAGSILFSYLAYSNKHIAGSKYFAAMLMAISIWIIAYAVELQYAHSVELLFYARLMFVGIAFVPPLWLLFTLSYTGHENWITGKKEALLYIIPIFTVIASLTNYNDIFYIYTVINQSNGAFVYTYSYGIAYYIHTAYSYALLLAGALVFIKTYFELPKYYRLKVLLILFGIGISITGITAYNIGLIPNLMLDITPFFYIISGILIYIAVFISLDSEIMPIAKDTIIELMDDPVIVLDSKNIVIDHNPAALWLVNSHIGEKTEIIGSDISKYFPKIKEELLLAKRSQDKKTLSCILPVTKVDKERKNGNDKVDLIGYYNLRITPISPEKENGGYLLVMKDDTFYRSAEKELILRKEHYLDLYNNITDGIVLHTEGSAKTPIKILDTNIVIRNILGFTKEEFEDLSEDEIIKNIGIDEVVDKIRVGSYAEFTKKIVKRDGTKIYVSINSHKVDLGGDSVILTLLRDITDYIESRKLEKDSLTQIEMNLTQLSKLSSKIRNPIGIIKDNCPDSEKTDDESSIMSQINTIEGIVNRLDMNSLDSAKIHKFLKSHYDFYDSDENSKEGKLK